MNSILCKPISIKKIVLKTKNTKVWHRKCRCGKYYIKTSKGRVLCDQCVLKIRSENGKQNKGKKRNKYV